MATMSLDDAIADATLYATGMNPAPTSEANTCNWIIYPLLLACGYKPYEIHAENTSMPNIKPDYTILPGTAHAWFLEAKSWTVTLNDTHATQATTYAYQNSSRWAVLTNGQEWRLYDSHIPTVAQRLVVQASLSDTSSVRALLSALSHHSMTTGGIEQFVQDVLLKTTLSRDLTDPNSATIKAIHKVLKGNVGLSSVKPQEIVAYFSPSVLATTPTPTNTIATVAPTIAVSTIATTQSFKDIASDPTCPITGTKPSLVTLPDGTTKVVKTWTDVFVFIVEWIGKISTNSNKPLNPQQYNYRLNTTPQKSNLPMERPATITFRGNLAYLETNRSARRIIGDIQAIGVAENIVTDQILLTYE